VQGAEAVERVAAVDRELAHVFATHIGGVTRAPRGHCCPDSSSAHTLRRESAGRREEEIACGHDTRAPPERKEEEGGQAGLLLSFGSGVQLG